MLFHITENIRDIKEFIRRDEVSEIIYPAEIPEVEKQYEFLKELIKDSNPEEISEYNTLLSGLLAILSSLNYRFADYEKSRNFVMEKLELDETENNVKGLARCYSIIGNLYLDFGDIPRSISMHLKRLDICRKLNDRKGIAISLTNLANTEMINKNYEKSLIYNLEAIETYKGFSTSDSKYAAMLGNLGQSYYYLKEYDKGLQYMIEALEIKKDNDDYSKSNIFTTVGCTYADSKRYDMAFEYFAKALESAKKFNDLSAELTTLLAIANTNMKLGNIDKAINILTAAIEEHSENSNELLFASHYFSLYECYKIKNDHKNSFKYFSDYMKLTEQIELQDSDRIISNLKNLHELENIRIYNKAKILRNEQLKSTLDKLEKVNLELNKTNKEKNELLSIIAHDLRNPVSNIKLLSEINFTGEQAAVNEPDVLQDTEIILTTCDDIINILNELVEPGTKANASRERSTSFDIIKLLNRSITLFNLISSNKKQSIKLISRDEELYIKSDYRSVYQIIDNLLSNSIKFSPDESQIEINVHRERNCIILKFKDNAGGFTEEQITKYFGNNEVNIDLFRDSDKGGFGLSVVNKLIRNISGNMTCSVITENGFKGSIIEITIPDNTVSIL